MATVQELLQERVARLRELTDQIEEEISGEADLGRLSELADQLGAQGDEFASTVSEAQEVLAGGGEGEEQAGDGPEGSAAGEESGEADEGDGEEG